MSEAHEVYKVRNWDGLYENNISRKVKNLTWVATPNKHDGRGFRRLLRMPDGIALYGAWHLILQVASKMPTRGILADMDGPLTAQDIADKTGCPPETVSRALKVCSAQDIGWLEVSPISQSPGVAGEHPDMPGDSPSVPGPDPGIAGPDPGMPGVKEGKGTEGKGTEGKRARGRGAVDSPYQPSGDTGLHERFIEAFLAAGCKLSEAHVLESCRTFISFDEAEQVQIVEHAERKARVTEARYMGLPARYLEKGEWRAKGTGRTLPPPAKGLDQWQEFSDAVDARLKEDGLL